MGDEAGQHQDIDASAAIGLKGEMDAAAADILRRRRLDDARIEQCSRLRFRRHVELVAQTLCQRIELTFRREPVAGQHEIADQVAGVDFAERIERDETTGMRGCGGVVGCRMLLLHHALERLDRPAAQGLPPEEGPLVELRTVAGRKAVEEVGLIELASAFERALIASLLEQQRIDLQVDGRGPADCGAVGREDIAERELKPMQQPPEPRADHLRFTLRPQHGRNGIASNGPLGLGQVDQQGKTLAQRQRAEAVVAPNLREAERPDA